MNLSVLLTRELYRIMATFGWTPRDVEELTLGELFDAWGVAGMMRLQGVADGAHAGRIAQAEGKDFSRAMKALEA